MTEAKSRFDIYILEARSCIGAFDQAGHVASLRHVWIAVISAFELYMTELIAEAGLRLIDRNPPALTANLRQVQVPLEKLIDFEHMSPTDRLLFYRQHIYTSVQYKSFYRPEKLSEALSLIWLCQPKFKWSRILSRMKSTGRYDGRTEEGVRNELTLIGDRRDLIAHSVDTPPGLTAQNMVRRDDAVQVVTFIEDLVFAIDEETESQFAMPQGGAEDV